MRLLRKSIPFLMAAGLLAGIFPMEALAATKYITNISLRVHAELDPGDSIDDGDSISIDDGDGEGTYVYTSASRYRVIEAEWAGDKNISIGDEPKMYVWLEIDDDNYDDEYRFRSSYSSSSVSISGGTFISASRSGGDLKVTLRVSGVKGTYNEPEDAHWASERGKAVWEPGEDSTEYYDIYLYRGSTAVKKVEDYRGTSYNFYPYMTREGDYTFRVRTIPHTESEKKYGKKSDWMESDTLYISEEDVSDGTGQSSGNYSGQGNLSPGGGVLDAGWIQDGDTWYFKYPDGKLVTGTWLKWNDRWYLFDDQSRMLTGWQQTGGYWYYLSSSGAMKTGWVQSGDIWYYCNPNEGGPEGAMVTNSWITVNGQTYFVNSSGVMVEGWYEIQGNWYYFQPGQGQKLTNTTVNGFVLDANGVWQH